MKTLIKIIRDRSHIELEMAVNKLIADVAEVVSVQYQTYTDSIYPYFSALVVYKIDTYDN